MRRTALALLGACLLSGCAALSSMGVDPDTPYTYTDPATGEEVDTTVGEAMADQIDAAGGVASNIAGKALGVATGNPVVGVSASALMMALLGAGTSRLRKKKQPEPTAEE